jgi:hypothetical protein
MNGHRKGGSPGLLLSTLVAALLLTSAGPGQSQQYGADGLGSADPGNPATALSTSGLAVQADDNLLGMTIVAGAGLGAAGFVLGGLAGYGIARAGDDYCEDWCGFPEAMLGAAVGGTLGMALGVHLGNKRRGSFALDFLVGALVWGAGIGVVALSDGDETVGTIAAITIPVAQLAGTIWVERSVGQKRSRSQDVAVSIVPHRDGAALALTVEF